jgi:hypothetical protein
MNARPRIVQAALALGIALALGAAPALAEKPEWAGDKGKGHGKGKHKVKHFDDDKRSYIRTYYDSRRRTTAACRPGRRRNGAWDSPCPATW